MEKYLVAAASPDLQVANTPYNVQKIKEKMKENGSGDVRILLFPRLCLCGVTCGDLFFQPTLLEECLEGLNQLVDCSKFLRPVFVVGMPMRIGEVLCDVAVAFSRGRVLGIIPNTNLSIDDRRYFSVPDEKQDKVRVFDVRVPCSDKLLLNISSKKSAVVIGNNHEGILESAATLNGLGADILLHLASETEGVEKPAFRAAFAKNASADGLIYLSSNPAWGESTSWDVYSGQKLYAENGALYMATQPFDDETLVVDVAEEKDEIMVVSPMSSRLHYAPFLPKKEIRKTCNLILEIQSRALAKRLAHAHAKTAVIGVSGGLDSTLALLVINRAFDILKKDKKEIIAITMPGFGTTGKTLKNALSLIANIGATSKKIDIRPSVLQHFRDIEHDKDVLNTTYENAQARTRTLILMDIANATGGIVVGTGDLSEAALGWCTYNGDHMSMYSVNATVPKTLIRKVVEVVADNYPASMRNTLISVLNTEISPELLPPSKEGTIAQKTEELVGPYDLMDFFLYYGIKRNSSPKEVYLLAKQAFDGRYDGQTIKKWQINFYKRFFTQQFKRSCAPDGANVGTISFAPTSWRMPADACVDIWLKEIEGM